MSNVSDKHIQKSLEDIFTNIGTLVAAAILFGLSLALSGGLTHPPTTAITSVSSPVIDIGALVQQFIAGVLFVVGIFLAFIKQKFGISFALALQHMKAIAVGGLLLTIGTTLLGLANSMPDLLSKSVLDILGGIFVLIGIYLGGTLALAVSESSK
jgi:hypothetical protein